ncbi:MULTISPECIES: MFS transporter [unclassified Gilvimarinus]|uniref:MFS transporter n=1 Tax=unclassified Gilvimarinus TaxID=2642066 RepID=UPI0026E38A62|nr:MULTISPECIES: MFS transporter [unclassified Gilvimarinus]MDO6570482.1 MFS transporter [Gilvimarinus sp. 2_MG-2023]MDO6746536.1 MFS transporter [Gilvimarinus sp. 1_MG-2023]
MQHDNESTQPKLSKGAMWMIEIALAIGGFGIGTGEFAAMGLMPPIAEGLGVSEPQVGHVISAYAFGVVVGAPLLAVFGAKLFHRNLLLLLMGFYAIANIASALAPNYETLLGFRFIAGLPHGTYFGVAALVVASLVPPSQRGKAVSRVMVGLTVAVLIGNPMATWLGQSISWRYAFALVGVISVLTVILIYIYVPLNHNQLRNNPMAELKAFNKPEVWLALMIGATGFAGVFCVFSYLAPTLLNVTQVHQNWIPITMATFGLGGFCGNFLGGWLFDKFQFKAVGGLLLWSIVVLLLYPHTTAHLWSILPAVFLVGTIAAISPPLQTHLMDVAVGARTLGAASHHAAFNTANAIGPMLGGFAISAGLGWSSTGYMGAITAVLGLMFYGLAVRREKSDGRLS